jgi:hypothetical protein
VTPTPAAAVTTPRSGIAKTLDHRRLEAFCSPAGPEVFHSIVRPEQIWTADPFDVEDIHQHARENFQRLLLRATMSLDQPSGRMLLLKGESGSGKTHLMRAFRTYVHANDRGYFGYLQMTSQVTNYARYVLAKLIDALDQPYRWPGTQTSALLRLAMGLLESLDLTSEELEQFRDGFVPDLPAAVEGYADRILVDNRFDCCDLDLIRALLYLQRNETRVRLRVLKWLRCEELAPSDRAVLGGIVPRTDEEGPLQMIVQLGRLMGAVHGMPLVLCVDQLEDMTDLNAAPEQFRRVMNTLTAIAEELPSSVVVLSCLEDYFASHRQYLSKPKLDRIENDPEPIRLSSPRTAEEVKAIVARRLNVLYEEMNVSSDGQMTTFPFTAAHLNPLAGMRTRDVLDYCRRHRERCIQAGRWLEPPADPIVPPPLPPDVLALEQDWNDCLARFAGPVPDEEDALAELLAWAVKQCSDELTPGYFFAAENEGRMIPVEAHGPGNMVSRLLVAVCDRSARGGGLGKQITEVESRSGETPIVLVRSTPYPRTPTAQVSKQIAAAVKRGGRRVVVENADWRRMLALRTFHGAQHHRPEFSIWLREGHPLSQMPSLRHILDLDKLPRPAQATHPIPPTPQPVASKPAAAPQPMVPAPASVTDQPSAVGPLQLGARAGPTPGLVTIEPAELTQHAAFLGGSGSGKTTAALSLIEQLLERGIPAVLLDRKGDLCRYADPAAWQGPCVDSEEAARRQLLRSRLDIAVYTPGQPEGRPLMIPIAPEGMDVLPTLEREQHAGYAAAALGSMIGYKTRGADQSRLAILRKAIEVRAALPGVVTIQDLYRLVDDRDDALLSAVGGFDDRLYKKLGDELLTLALQHKHLLAAEGERLDIDALLGRNAPAGKTRLSIISTRFLGDSATVDFWVSQLLAALGRWIGKNPRDRLQALFLFDEADLYLPATRQPATKAPMENLLKRARSAGVGLMLATQSPGDFDYKCRDTIRTWLVGRVKEQTALDKLRPMLSECKTNVAAKLPGQGTGQFHLIRERQVCAIQTRPSLVATAQLSEEQILRLARGNAPSHIVAVKKAVP